MLPFLPLVPWALPLQILASDEIPQPVYEGDSEAETLLEPWIQGALKGTATFGSWPPGAWTVQLHESNEEFDRITGSAPGRAAIWMGATLHLRPWKTLRLRDIGALLRHELTHRRLAEQHLERWKEEAACIWAEQHTRPPEAWPQDPDAAAQKQLNTALESGTTASQRWAYQWLRAWLEHRPLPVYPSPRLPSPNPWQVETLQVKVAWPPERLPRVMKVNGRDFRWAQGARFEFEGEVHFGPRTPVSRLDGQVTIDGVQKGWKLTWITEADTWIAAATEGELGASAPFEAKRALAAVLRLWLTTHPAGKHPDGSFCPLTHCVVVRGMPTPGGLRAATQAPALDLAPDRAFFTTSKGGVSWSPLEVWGHGSAVAGSSLAVPQDRWGTWFRRLTAAQVRILKATVKPGLKPGQRGLRLGHSGPYSVESLRLATGRRFGWTAWPSNACEASIQPDGSLILKGHGLGHNVGLCLATAVFRAGRGDSAEAILEEAFGLEEP
jgi:hypothetical protein